MRSKKVKRFMNHAEDCKKPETLEYQTNGGDWAIAAATYIKKLEPVLVENRLLKGRIAKLEKELSGTKDIIVAHQIADADGYIDDHGWVANWSEMEDGMVSLFEAHNLEQQAKGIEDALDEDEITHDGWVTVEFLKDCIDNVRGQVKTLQEQVK